MKGALDYIHSQDKSKVEMSESGSLSETNSLLPNWRRDSNTKHRSRLCSQSKGAILIILWTVFIGVAYSTFCTVVTLLILANYEESQIDNVITYPMSILYATLAIIAMLYPLIGWMADVSCGRVKVVLLSLCLVVFSYTIMLVCVLIFLILTASSAHVQPYIRLALSGVGCSASLVTFVAFAGYQANFIQLGLDQLVSAPSEDLALFVHWAIWAYNIGCTVFVASYRPYECSVISISAKATSTSIPLFLTLFFILLLIVTCCKHQWLHSEQRRRSNPCKSVTMVLNFARKHKYPLCRSAFTYSDDEMPTRLDFAKQKYGGPYTTEQVEDVKSFFKIVALLVALGPIFILDVPSSYTGMMVFGYHVGDVHINNTHGFIDHCSTWNLLWSGNLKYISGTVMFPIYIWFIFSYLHSQTPRIFARMFFGIVTYIAGVLSLLVIDLVGHTASNNETSAFAKVGSVCMFDMNLYSSRHLHLHWMVMVAPSILLGVGPLVVMTTVLEFISAQSPHFMKGLLVGILFAIIGLFQLIGALALIPFSMKEIWDTMSMRLNPPVASCGFGYLLFTSTFAIVGLVLLAAVAKKYTYRVRDDKPYNQSQVEEIVSRYLESPEHSYSYS